MLKHYPIHCCRRECISRCVYLCMYLFVCMYMYVYAHVPVCIHVCMYISVCMCLYLCHCICWTINIFELELNWIEFLTFSISLNNGSVWALYLLFVIMRRTRFCSLNILFHSKPQHVIPNCRWDKIKESYMSFMAENGRYLFSLFIIPSVREILLAIFAECELQFIN